MSGSEAKKRGAPANLKIEVGPDADGMQMLLDGVVPPNGLELFNKEMLRRLGQLKISDPALLEEATRSLAAAAAENHELSSVVLFSGQASTPSKDGEVDWADDFFNTGFAVDPETGNIDYRKRAAKRSVEDGQLLGKVLPPVPGKPGKDVLGHVVPARKPASARIREGRNVLHDEAADAFYATSSGQIRFIKGVLFVEDVFTVSGSVDLESGNIDHPGALVVEEHIESESQVEAKGDVFVGGYIGNAEVTCGGSLAVRAGITGGDKCVIRVAGDVHARFIQNADIEAEGDIVVEREIDQSTIKTRGAVRVAQGRIVGGHISALKGIKVRQIGSDAYLRTELHAGEDYRVKDALTEKEAALKECRATLTKIVEKLEPIRRYKQSGRPLPPKLKQIVTVLAPEAKKLQATMAALEEEMATIRAEFKERAVREITVSGTVYPDVFFSMWPHVRLLKESVTGPMTISPHGKEIRLVGARSEGSPEKPG